MKARWLLITLLLAFPFAFAFFMSEARRGERRAAKPALVVAPLSTTPAVEAHSTPDPAPDISPIAPMSPIGPISENPAPKSTPPPSDEEIVEFARPFTVSTDQPVLLEGTFTKESNAFLYEPDAKLQLPNNVFLSSPTGVMVSDEQQKIFAGDMQLLTQQQTISANEAVLTLQPGGSSILTSKTLSIASNDNSQPALEIKGDNLTLTLPAKKPPAPPLVPTAAPGATDLAPPTSPP